MISYQQAHGTVPGTQRHSLPANVRSFPALGPVICLAGSLRPHWVHTPGFPGQPAGRGLQLLVWSASAEAAPVHCAGAGVSTCYDDCTLLASPQTGSHLPGPSPSVELKALAVNPE